MRAKSGVVLVVAVAFNVLGIGPANAQIPQTLQTFGGPVAPMFEGWYRNADGTATILVGAFNANSNQTVDLPVGALNQWSPGPHDRGQPTHFPPGRSWGVLSIQVPADFDGNLTWALTAHDQPAAIPVHLDAPYFIEPLRDAANGNEPPTIRFAEDGRGFTGPPVGIAHSLTASVGMPRALTVWTSDVKPEKSPEALPNPFEQALTLNWHLHRSPAAGAVEFSAPTLRFKDSADQAPTITATFSEPGEYLLRVEALDETGAGGGGFQCCWTSTIVRVTVQNQETPDP